MEKKKDKNFKEHSGSTVYESWDFNRERMKKKLSEKRYKEISLS